MRQDENAILRRLGKALHLFDDDITREPLPRRWVDLIHHLDEQERDRSREHRPKSRRDAS
jgi:hypothetical protein